MVLLLLLTEHLQDVKSASLHYPRQEQIGGCVLHPSAVVSAIQSSQAVLSIACFWQAHAAVLQFAYCCSPVGRRCT